MKHCLKYQRPPAPAHRVKGLALALWSCSLLTLAAPHALAQSAGLPSGLAVVAGQAQVSTAGNRMTVVNTPQTILNWNSFSIGAGNSVYFQQANASSAVLNRVTGNEASSIFGSLASNGRVWLLNPNGVLFGASARVDVAGLVASTLRLSDGDWLAGRYSFGAGNAGASVVNEGELRSSFGGSIALLGDSVANSGLVQAPGGQIVLAAGASVELVDTGAANLSVKLTAPAGEARNLGTLQAAGGRIDIHAAAVNSSGIVSADGFASGPGGEVWIKASGTTELTGSSRTSASSSGDKGGSVVLLGSNVGLLDQAQVQADGATGGGSVYIGGGMRGQDTRYTNAQAVYFGPQAQVSANATASGNGGTVILWSDQATRAYGSIAARGGPLGGNGGFIETSGGWLDAQPAKIDTLAPLGRSGEWLLDPFDVSIVAGSTSQNLTIAGGNYTAVGTPAVIGSNTIGASLLAGTSVTVSTGSAGSETGSITLNGATVTIIGTSSASLTLQAANGITVTNGSHVDLDTGNISLNAGAGPITIQGASQLTTRGSGTITLTGSATGIDAQGNSFQAASSTSGPGVLINASTLTAANVQIGGLALSAATGFSGVQISGSSSVGGLGTTTIQGDGRSGPGILVGAGANVIARSLLMYGRGSGNGLDISGLAGQSITGTGPMELVGQSTSAAGFGVLVTSSGTVNASNSSGSVLISGYNADTVTGPGGFPGVRLEGTVTTLTPSTLIRTGDPASVAAEPRQVLELVGPIIMGASAGTLTMNASYINTNAPSLSSVNSADVTLTSGNGINFSGVNINLGGTISTLTLDAGAGAVAITGASTITTGSNFNSSVTIGGQGAGQAATGSGTDSGVLIAGTTSITSGTITLRGRTTGTGDGVRMTGGTLDGVAVNINGVSANANGFSFSGTSSLIQSSDSLAISGRAGSAGNGVIMTDGQIGQTGVGSSNITGVQASGNGGTGVTLGSGLRFVSNNPGSGFYVSGTEPSNGNLNAVLISGATINLRERVNITSPCSDCEITIIGSAVAARDGLLIDAGTGAVSVIQVLNSSISTSFVPGELHASYQTFAGTNTFTAADTELRFLQANGTAPTQPFFDNQGTMNMVNSGTGRWVVYASDINSALFRPGNLASLYDFKRYGATGAASWASDTGNGFASLTTASAAFTGNAINRVYDSTTAITFDNSGTLSGGFAGDYAVGTVANKNVGTGKAVSLNLFDSTNKPVYGYALNTSGATLLANVTQRALNVSGLAASNRVYDGSTAATLTGSASSAAALQGDVVTFGGTASGSFADKNVGNAKAVTVTGLTLAGADSGNYTLNLPALTANITPLALQLGGLSASSKVYDAGTSATVTGTANVTALTNDIVNVSGSASGSFADKNVGSAKAVTLGGLALTGRDAGNYTLQSASLTADITPRALTLGGLTANNKVYDGGTTASFSGTASVAALAGDTLNVAGTATGSFADRNVGSGKSVSLGGLRLAGADAGNYTLTLPTSYSASITPLALGLSGLGVATKVYDATTAATLTGTATASALAGDNVLVTGSAQAAFADKNAGTNKPVVVTGLTLSGRDAGNYTLAAAPLSGSITPLTVALSGLSATGKVYDGSVSATLAGSGAVTPLAGDSLTLAGTAAGSYADKNVGTAKAVTLSGLSLAGSDAGNYTLSPPVLSASIAPLALTLGGLAVAPKVYDAGTTANLTGSATLATLAGDSVTVSGSAQGSYADKDVSAVKAVTLSGLALAGRDAGNYTLTLPTLSGSITRRSVAVQGLSALDKTYDASTSAPLGGAASITPVAGDALNLSGSAAGSFADVHVGSAKPVSVSGLALAGADAGNYTLAPLQLSASIRPATLSYVAQPTQRVQGEPIGLLLGGVSGFAGTDTLPAATTGVAVFSTTATELSALGNYPITGSGLQARDYVFTQAPANATAFTMNPVPVTRATPVVVAVTSAVVASSNGGSSTGTGTSGGAGSSAASAVVAATQTAAATASAGTAGLLDMSAASTTVAATGTVLASTVTTSSSPASSSPASTASAVSTTVSATVAASNSSVATTATSAASSFAAVRLSSLSARELATLLDTRRAYTENLFAEAGRQLAANPTLADVKACRSIDEAASGLCLITPELKARLATTRVPAPVTVAAASSPSVSAASAASAAPAVPGVTAASPTPQAAAAAQQQQAGSARRVAATQAAVARMARLQDSRRSVQQAALPQIQRKLALVIGVGSYDDSAIPGLANAVGDARAVAQTLETRLGYEAVVLEDASKAEIVAAMNRIALTAGPHDSVIVYYAGHGELVATTQQGYWLPADGNAQRPESWLSNADINRLVAQIGASQVALISDSCYSGTLATDERLRAGSEALNPATVLDRKSVVVMSSGGNQPVADEGRDGHSPFAYYLMENLAKVNQWQPGGNVFERVRFAVARALPQRPQYSASRSAGHQAGGEYLFEQRQLGPDASQPGD